MGGVKLILGLESLAISSKGSISTLICFEINGRFFPEKEWSDLAIVLLNLWIKSLYEMVTGSNSEANLYFMDGPFRIKIKNEIDFIKYELIVSDNVIETGRACIDLQKFLSSILGIAKQVLFKCDENGWRTEEVIKLEENINVNL